ncbi:LacI family DNA-binding transcriptional regulator [Roseateles violae]|uniref:LacI family DNA-binding transcriptional regulator n=1 Tax=Roseateles violae TaxID=3058042 RepID=A0ABT8DLS4_9BURK|nr:LacI family DNA-binding transcriptional regulator [Pelomonas sp. PFR6]MDN3919370.1 LacI family DNA-binding transcriptional regulator [Pelomonas sp. PFR6]
MPKSSVTLVDVAKKAGVALVTTSRALNGTGFVSDETRNKVVAAAKALGYSPNLTAKILKGGRTNLLGLVVSNLHSAPIIEVIAAVSLAVKQAGLDLIIYNASTELGVTKQQDIHRVLGSLCEGILLALPTAQEGQLAEFESSKVPVVLLNYWRNQTGLPTVRADNYHGARAAVEHLIGLGHNRIAFITGSSYTGQSHERQRGYQDALKQAGIRPVKGLIVQGDFSQSSGFNAAQQLMALPKPPTAIFAANDSMSFGVMDALKERGLQIPGHVSVIGFDDIPASNHVYPRLSTVRQPLAEISTQAVRLIMRRIRPEAAQPVADDSLIELPSALVIRDSCGPAPTAGLA